MERFIALVFAESFPNFHYAYKIIMTEEREKRRTLYIYYAF